MTNVGIHNLISSPDTHAWISIKLLSTREFDLSEKLDKYYRSSDKGPSVLCVPRHAITPKERTAIGYIFFPLKLGIEEINKNTW